MWCSLQPATVTLTEMLLAEFRFHKKKIGTTANQSCLNLEMAVWDGW